MSGHANTVSSRCLCTETLPAPNIQVYAGHITNTKVLMVSDWRLIREATWLRFRACGLLPQAYSLR